MIALAKSQDRQEPGPAGLVVPLLFFHNTKSLTSHFLWCHSGTIEAGWHILSIAALPHSFGLDFVTARSCDDPDKKREICRWGLFTTNRSKCIGPSSRIGS